MSSASSPRLIEHCSEGGGGSLLHESKSNVSVPRNLAVIVVIVFLHCTPRVWRDFTLKRP